MHGAVNSLRTRYFSVHIRQAAAKNGQILIFLRLYIKGRIVTGKTRKFGENKP